MNHKLNLSILLMISSLCSCSNDVSSINNSNLNEISNKKINIKIAIPTGENKDEIFNKAIDDYKKINPNVIVSIDWKSSNDFYSSYKNDLSSNINFPDGAFIDHTYLASLASLDLIIPVNSYIEKAKDKYVDNIIEANNYLNNYYGFPFSANTICLFYNKDILGDREVPKTYNEFLTIGQEIYNEQLNKESAKRDYVFSLPLGNTNIGFGTFVFNSWLKRENGSILSSDFKNATIDTNEMKNALNKWKEIVDKGFASASESYESRFYSGDVAFIEMGCWVIPTLIEQNTSNNFKVAPLFSLSENGNNNSSLGLYSLCVSKQEDESKMQAASDFCSFLSTNLDLQLSYAKNVKCLPVTKDACNDEYYLKDEWKVFIDSMPYAAIRPSSPIYSKIEDEIASMYNKVLQGRSSIDDATKAVNGRVQNFLNAFYK